MRAIQLVEYANSAGLIERELPDPEAPGTGQVIINVDYAAVNLPDFVLAQGKYFLRPELPSVIGSEGSGLIAVVGADVDNVRVGDRVTIPFGTFAWAQKLKVPATNLFVVDPRIDAQQAAMLSIAPTTAALMLNAYGPTKPGDWFAFNMANSMVGQTLLALARSKGLRTIAIVRRPELVVALTDNGADVAFLDGPDLSTQVQSATQGALIAVAFDGVGGKSSETLVKLLAPGGKLVVYAPASGQPVIADQFDLIAKNIEIHGFSMYRDPSRLNAATAEVGTLVAGGQLNLPVARVFRPAQIDEAINHLLTQRGKALLDFRSSK